MVAGSSVVLLVGGLFTLIFGGIGLFFLFKYLSEKRKAEDSQSWPSTSGMIETSTITSNTSTDADGYSSTTYSPVIVYSYNVLGTPFNCKRVGFGLDVSGSEAGAMSVISKYPVGKPVTVFYNPDNPGEAVLEKTTINTGPTIVLLSVFLGIGLISCMVSAWLLVSLFLPN